MLLRFLNVPLVDGIPLAMNQHTPKDLYPLNVGSLQDGSQKQKSPGKQGKTENHSAAGVKKTNPAFTVNYLAQSHLHF